MLDFLGEGGAAARITKAIAEAAGAAPAGSEARTTTEIADRIAERV